MGKPSSFKDAIKPAPQVPAPKLSGPILKSSMTPEQILVQKERQKTLERFCNTQRCPLCEAQLDGGVFPGEARLFCRAYPEEFTCVFVFGNPEPVNSSIRISYDCNQYEVIHDRTQSGSYINSVYVIDLTMRVDLRHKFKKKMFDFEGSRLIIPKTTTEAGLLSKLKTYIIFS
jgi:hypothetical protein